MKKLTSILVLFLAFSLSIQCYAQTSDEWTKEKAEKWFANATWKDSLKLNAHESTDKVEFAKQYHKNKALWDKAFAYLRDTNLDTLSPGKYPIDGTNLFASVTETPTKDFEKTKCESHAKYIDLQYVIKGKEKMGVGKLSDANITTPLDPAKDNAFYDCPKLTFYEATPGTFFLFFPSDAHRPSIKIEGCDSDKKIVIKIKVAEN